MADSADSDAQPNRSPVFISYASRDRTKALAINDALERRGIGCWIAACDVAPGENYQEAIVRTIRNAPAIVLLFSAAANDSDEIKKELSLASRYKVPVLTLRIEDVEPSDAFAYELSTRQWIDGFGQGDGATDTLASRLSDLLGREHVPPPAPPIANTRRASAGSRRGLYVMIAAAVVLVAAGAWFLLRPSASAAHPMVVRLAGFKSLSGDLPPTLGDAVDAEISAAFNADGVVGVSNAAAPAADKAPAYALGGTIQRTGSTIRVISTLTNERSGTALWSRTTDYDGKETARIPRRIAVDAGNVVRCGLFGASTYRKPLPDPVMRDYLQFCEGHWNPVLAEGDKALVPAERVVAALPDFSWGWAAVAGAYWKVALTASNDEAAAEARRKGREAADRGIAIDKRNSEALYIKAVLTDRNAWLEREALFKRAIGARRLDCGCEYHQYGWLLASVGRMDEAVDTLRRAHDMLALYLYTPLTLAFALSDDGRMDEAAKAFDSAIDLAPTSDFAGRLTVTKALNTDDVAALRNPALPIPSPYRETLIRAYAAAGSGNGGEKAAAAKALLALPQDEQSQAVAILLAKLGDTSDSLRIAARWADDEYPGPTIFWKPAMRPVLDDPGFPAVAQRLGLIDYWRKSGTRPDVCKAGSPPAFCRII